MPTATNSLVGTEALEQTLRELHADQQRQDAVMQQAAEEIRNHNDRILALERGGGGGGGAVIEGYLRVAGSSDPNLSYRHYAIQDGVDTESVFSIYYPCLVGNNLTGNVGMILHKLRKFGARAATASDTGFTQGQAVWDDLEGTPHAIDGSEGDVMVVNIAPYWEIAGHYDIEGTTLDVFLRSRQLFTWNGIEARMVEPYGESPDYTVAHNDNGTVVMHSVYNPSWNGSYSTPYGVAGRYVVTEENGELVETYDANATMLGGAGGLHTTGLALYTGEQYAMNMQGGTAPVPYYNKTANNAERLWAGLACEGGTFDSHKAALFGSGFTSNDAANEATYLLGGEARNGLRVYDKDGTPRYYSFGSNVRFLTGLTTGTQYGAYCINSWRNPWHCMEAYRAVCYAIQHEVPELTWFAFEGCKYKWRSVEGFAGPSMGEATCVVFKMMSTQAGANAVDPTDLTTSIAGNRVDVVVSTGLWHGITTQASPLWWTSGLIFTEDENGTYEAYMERDQSKLIKSENGEIAVESQFNFERQYEHVMTLTYGSGYRKNYNNKALMLPDTDANKTGAGLHTYVGAYNYYTGGKASAGKKVVRGFQRGDSAYSSVASPLYVYAYNAPSNSSSIFAFGTCVRIVDES